MTFALDLPSGPVVAAALDSVYETESRPVAHHSIRSFLFARLVAEHEGLRDDPSYDEELLFAATVMHDLGAGSRATGRARFEVEGADLAVEVLRGQGVDDGRVETVWEAIALHTSEGIAERRGLLAYLTHRGIGVDFGRHAEIVAAHAERIHAMYPRLQMVRSLVDAIVERASRSEAAAPPWTVPGEMLRERNAHGITLLEKAAVGSPWGE